MKRLLSLLAVALLAIGVQAQETLEKSPAWSFLGGFIQENPNVLHTTNITFGVAPAYGSNIRNKSGALDHWGVSVFASVPTESPNIAITLRGDYIASEVFLSSGNVTLKEDVVIAKRLKITPFVFVGAGTSITGTDEDGSAVGITGIGAQIRLGRWLNADWSVGGDYEKWIGVGFEWEVVHAGVKGSWSF